MSNRKDGDNRDGADRPVRRNHLEGQQSLYLRQHAHNPIDWYPWGEEAINRARQENKPIFLSIGYSSCHWCHVMEKEVFEKEDVAALMNDKFISIKVDREERPDLDMIYMEAVQALTGSGGWPMSVFLTPELKPFYGGTYIPHARFIELARAIAEIFADKRTQVEDQAARLAEIAAANPAFRENRAIDISLIDEIVSESFSLFDNVWGGFREGMKFPQPVKWRFLLHYYRKTGRPELGEIIRRTLDSMATGGIYDHIGGGFHRYAVERTWLIPHFEKMLYDNGQLAGLYTEAWAVFGDPIYEQIARGTLDFLLNELSAPGEAVFASLDADSDGREGAFYTWRYDEIIKVIGGQEAAAIAQILGVTPEGNFEGVNVISRRNDSNDTKTIPPERVKEMQESIDKNILRLREYRSARPRPALDNKIIVSWNGLAISALVQGYCAFGKDEYLRKAIEAADYIWKCHRRPDGGLWRTSYGGRAENPAYLDDYALFARALFDLFEVARDPEWLRRAVGLIEYLFAHFRNPEGGYYISQAAADNPLGRKIDFWDGPTPSGNAAFLSALHRAALLTGNERYHEEIERCLLQAGQLIRRLGLEMAGWLDTALLHGGPAYTVVISGGKEKGQTNRLIDTFRRLAPPYACLIVARENGTLDEIAEISPVVVGKTSPRDPAAHICRRGECLNPVSDPDELAELLRNGWKY